MNIFCLFKHALEAFGMDNCLKTIKSFFLLKMETWQEKDNYMDVMSYFKILGIWIKRNIDKKKMNVIKKKPKNNNPMNYRKVTRFILRDNFTSIIFVVNLILNIVKTMQRVLLTEKF